MSQLKSNHKKKLILFAFVVVVAAVLVFISILAKQESIKQQNREANLYFVLSSASTIKVEKRMVPNAEGIVLIQNLLKELEVGPRTEGMQQAIPSGVKILGVALEDTVATVDLSKEYLTTKPGEELLCRAAIVYTLTELDFVENVAITIQGEPLMQMDRAEMGLMNRENVLIDVPLTTENEKNITVRLYFADKTGKYLEKEERKITIGENVPREKAALEQLVAGPKDKSLLPVIPPDTKIRDVTTTEDGICYINLSQEFLTKHTTIEFNEKLVIYAIVNTLAELPTVQKVQFLVDGEKLDMYKDKIDCSHPLAPLPILP